MTQLINLLFRPLRLILRGLFLSAASLPISVFAETVEISIAQYRYQPAVVQIAPGDTIRWINRERRQYHSVQLQRDGSSDPLLDSQYLFPGDHWEHTFTQIGRYSYLCGPHPEMQGRVEVVAAE